MQELTGRRWWKLEDRELLRLRSRAGPDEPCFSGDTGADGGEAERVLR